MCRKCVATLSTISPMMKEHLKEGFVTAMLNDLRAFDEDVPVHLIAYEVCAESLKSTVDAVLMDEVTFIFQSALRGDMGPLADIMGEASDFQREWA